MFESFMAVPLHFTVEFLGFLVTAGGAILIMSRPSLIPGASFNRATAALGFASLATAQVLHGGSFGAGQTDDAQLLIALHTLGFALIMTGVVGGLRSGAIEAPLFLFAATDGSKLATPGALAPAGAAILLALISVVAAKRSGLKALRMLALGALLLAGGEVLLGLAPPGYEFGVSEIDSYAYGSHFLKFFGYLAFTVWLWSGVRSSIRTRFVAAFSALLVAVVLTLATALTGVISSNVEDEVFTRVGNQLDNGNQVLEDQAADIQGVAETLHDAFTSTDFSTKLSNKDALFRFASDSVGAEDPTVEIDLMIFADPRGEILAFSGVQPFALSPRGRELKPKELTLSDASSIVGTKLVEEVAERSTLSVSPVRVGDSLPILAATKVRQGDVSAILIVGSYIDQLTLEDIGALVSPTEATLLVGDRVVARTEGLLGVTRREVVPPSIRVDLELGKTVTTRQTIGNQTYYGAVRRLQDSSDNQIDATLVLSSPSNIVVETRQGVTRILFLVAMGVGAVALVLAWFSGRRITRPIQVLTKAAQMIREGNLGAKAAVEGEDEVGQLGETFNEMTSSLLRMTEDLREAAREEHSLRTRIETIIQSMADGLVAVDSEGKILAFNREAENLTGIKAKSAMGRSIEKILETKDSQGEPARLPIHDLTEGSVAGVFLSRRVGESVPIAVTSAVLRDDEGQLAGAVAVVRDMTREREIERMKSEFLANISHELRTPLTPIKGYAEILARKDVPPERMRGFVNGILESTERLERIVGLLVDFSAMEAGRLSPRNAPVDVGDILKKLGEEWAKRSTRHEVVIDVRARLPKVVGDERLLRRSFEEVIDNAVKFSPDGGVIKLVAKGASGANGQPKKRFVAVTVSDEGIGIQEKDLSRIFSDFHQLDGSETRTYGGLGLGLAFVQRIVEAHSGSISVESVPDEGTSLTISIPAGRAK